MSEIESLLKDALEKALESDGSPGFNELTSEFSLFETLESISIVSMLLEVEAEIELATGRYVSLADETIFDASKSPLRSWSSWVSYVEARHAK